MHASGFILAGRVAFSAHMPITPSINGVEPNEDTTFKSALAFANSLISFLLRLEIAFAKRAWECSPRMVAKVNGSGDAITADLCAHFRFCGHLYPTSAGAVSTPRVITSALCVA